MRRSGEMSPNSQSCESMPPFNDLRVEMQNNSVREDGFKNLTGSKSEGRGDS